MMLSVFLLVICNFVVIKWCLSFNGIWFDLISCIVIIFGGMLVNFSYIEFSLVIYDCLWFFKVN